jgi:hydrogenase maturation protease
LVFGYGNPSRGDDALGPRLIERLERRQGAGELTGVDLLTDFQLQVEHAMDLKGRERVVFVDADLSLEPPFQFTPVVAEQDASYTTHAMSPGAVLRVLEQIGLAAPLVCSLLAIRGYAFALGTPLSERACANLVLAEAFLLRELVSPP